MINLSTVSRNSKGFTLIELLVVVAIIGLLASIVIVSLSGVRTGARDSKGKADLRQMQTAMEVCYQSRTPNSYTLDTPMATVGAWADIPAGRSIVCGTRSFMDNLPTTAGVTTYQWNDNPPDGPPDFGASADPTQDYGFRVQLEDIVNCFIVTPTGVNEIGGAC